MSRRLWVLLASCLIASPVLAEPPEGWEPGEGGGDPPPTNPQPQPPNFPRAPRCDKSEFEPPATWDDYWDSDTTNVPASERNDRPATRGNNYRNTISTSLIGDWKVYLGDLHAHSRGHAGNSVTGQYLCTPNINRSETNHTAWLFGYDFFAITNHSTSWKKYDDDAPLYEYVRPLGGTGTSMEMLALKGSEDYVGPDDKEHASSFHIPLKSNNHHMSSWHSNIEANYASDPRHSVHIQLNHPQPDTWFDLPPTDNPTRYAKVRDAIELAEYSGHDIYMDLLRRGFRVSPVANSDTHATFREQEWSQENGAYMDFVHSGGVSTWKRRYIPDPGVPREHWALDDFRRTGIVLPANESFTYDNVLIAMRERRTFRTNVPKASGFYAVNQSPMGSQLVVPLGIRSIDFNVWATTKNGTLADNAWSRLELWSPFQTERPVRVIDYTGANVLNLQQFMRITPFSPIYFIRLFQKNGPASEVILAPTWLSWVALPLGASFTVDTLNRGETACLMVTGGGEFVKLQQATFLDQTNDISGWRDWGVHPNNGNCINVPTSGLPSATRWRVVDTTQEDKTSNYATLNVRNALQVALEGPHDSFITGRPLRVRWSGGGVSTASYTFSYSTDYGISWLTPPSATVTGTGGVWEFNTAGIANQYISIRLRDTSNPSIYGTTTGVFISAAPQLTWSSAGPVPGQVCTQWRERLDPHTWDDNFLCSPSNQGIRWSEWGSLPDMRCTEVNEGAEPGEHGWYDNYVCVPHDSPLRLSWSGAGPVAGKTCVQIYEGADPHTWSDNYLCY